MTKEWQKNKESQRSDMTKVTKNTEIQKSDIKKEWQKLGRNVFHNCYETSYSSYPKKELPSEPDCAAADLVIPDRSKITRRGEKNFLLLDTKDGDTANENEKQQENVRIIGFGTDDNLTKLANSEVWFFDGTFKTCPQLFHQICTIHYMFHGQTFSAVYTLLPGKTQEAYMHPCLSF